jgi:hypothetical protein
MLSFKCFATFQCLASAGSIGIDMKVNRRQDIEYLFGEVARHLTRVQEQGLGKPGLESLKAFK